MSKKALLNFRQSRGLLRIDASVDGEVLRFSEHGPLSAQEIEVPLAEISEQTVSYIRRPTLWLFVGACILFYFVSVVFRFFQADPAVDLERLVLTGICVAGLAWYIYAQSGPVIGFHTERGDLLFFDLPGDDSPRDFLEALQKAKRDTAKD